ncbi:MAG TPA: DUF2760 domain-containing protein [Verrucomicrobia bacterium]|nr:MAG: hypothetical protein A2X46_15705 [Lentisphaerae bacterium GWF2_57_35]HBA85674.1 DUF2760 domain-containing protein [Verrucomicrobiota bacterium]
MNKWKQAFRVFFRILRDAEYAQWLQQKEDERAQGSRPAARRSEAVTLLAVLQREGRLVDFLQETIDSYSDAQVGAAVRDVHRSCRSALERMFAPGPVLKEAEGEAVQVGKDYDPGRMRLLGNVAGEPPYNGTLVHSGWAATRCELPVWNGSEESIPVIAPAEVELK